MKKLSLIFFAVIASIAGTNAQYTTHNVYHVENPNRPSADHAIVRTDGIAYFEDNGQGYFAYINSLGGTYYEVKLPNNNWSVWDFRVLDGVAYFCGKDRFTNTALLGDFNIANLVSGSGSITFNYDINIGNSFAVLTRIAVASLKDTVSLMAIGQTDPNNDPNLEGSDQLLYIKDYSTSAGLLFSSTKKRVFWDVVATKKYFVMAATDSLQTTNLYLYTAPIGTTLSNFFSVFYNQYEYQCSREFVSGIRATTLNNDSIALASYYRYAPTTSHGLQVFTLNAADGIMKYNQYYDIPYTTATTPICPPKEMAFLPDSCFLMVTDTIIMASSGNVTLLRLDAYPTFPTWPNYYMAPHFEAISNTVHYSSLALLSPTSNYCLAASGASWTTFNMSTIIYYNTYVQPCHNLYMADILKSYPDTLSRSFNGYSLSYIKKMTDTLSSVSREETRLQCSSAFKK